MNKPKVDREKIKATLDEAEWVWFTPHLKRDAVILVTVALDLLLVATAVAEDDQTQVAEWVRKGWLTKPNPSQIEAWTKTPKKKFLSVIVQPYVLAQEHLVH